jgi:hypothetical protein
LGCDGCRPGGEGWCVESCVLRLGKKSWAGTQAPANTVYKVGRVKSCSVQVQLTNAVSVTNS